mmetsp:Transcript_8130/g.12461  ORF Transcript_8130/g.12461 Transcript_8130/m.12461 type:complete len:250 (+) Transcript_8130:135-884(+)
MFWDSIKLLAVVLSFFVSEKICCSHSFVLSSCSRNRSLTIVHNFPTIWIEDAEDDFVDDGENLEKGEICLKAVKAFATSPNGNRFLCAGALVQRPNSLVCDAWTADALPEDSQGGPNLVLQGARKILDALFLFHLQQNSDDSIRALRTFVLRCGSMESEYTCASFMAGQSRGFSPLKDQLRSDSIYMPQLYNNDFEGLIFDFSVGNDLYKDSVSDPILNENTVSKKICSLLPSKEMIQRYTTKRYRYSD